MCGRYALFASLKDICRAFGVAPSQKQPPQAPKSPYNIGPMMDVPVIIGDKLGAARWAFTPAWADNDDMAVKLKNARSETIHEKPMFRGAWEKGQTCLIPMNGFYEWQKTGAESGPHFVTPAPDANTALNDQTLMAAAGLWDIWGGHIGFTVLTKAARPSLSAIHHREPVLFAADTGAKWLRAAPQNAARMMADNTYQNLYSWRVKPDIGQIKNNDPSLLEADHHQNMLL